MALIDAYWDNDEQTFYVVECNVGWTWMQFVEVIDGAYAMIATIDHDVNFAMWFKSLPPGDAMTHLTHAGGTQPPNIRHTVIINNSTRFLDIMVKNADRKEGWVGPKIVQTLDEARDYLATLD